MSKKKFGIEFRILRSLLTEFRISNTEYGILSTECLSTGRLKKLVWIYLKTSWFYDDLLKIICKRKYMSRISYTSHHLLFNAALQIFTVLDETKIIRNSKFKIRQNSVCYRIWKMVLGFRIWGAKFGSMFKYSVTFADL